MASRCGCWSVITATPSEPVPASAPADQERLRALNAELSTFSTEFGNRLLADTNAAAVVVDDPAELDGLSPDAIAAAARAADGPRSSPAATLLPLVLPTAQPALAVPHRPRRCGSGCFRASISRGSRGNEHDTRDVVRRITALRAERAGLLGHPHHASWVIEVGHRRDGRGGREDAGRARPARGPQRRDRGR